MTCAYNKIYLEKAQTTFASMLDYAVNGCGLRIEDFYGMFLFSNVSKRFERGNASVVAGHSGAELVYEVMTQTGMDYLPYYEGNDYTISVMRSQEFWCGFVLSYYQWKTALSFERIESFAHITTITSMYRKYHEMDIEQFCDRMDEIRTAARLSSYLREYRDRMGYTQQELAFLAGIPLKTIQQYEQRQKNINRAAAETVISLSRVLHCRPEELMEA